MNAQMILYDQFELQSMTLIKNVCMFKNFQNADWIKSSAAKFDPEKNTVTTANGDEISYEYMVVAVGLQLRYDQVNFDFSCIS